MLRINLCERLDYALTRLKLFHVDKSYTECMDVVIISKRRAQITDGLNDIRMLLLIWMVCLYGQNRVQKRTRFLYVFLYVHIYK